MQDIWRSEIGDVERALEPFHQMQWGRCGGDYRELFIVIGSLRDHQGYLALTRNMAEQKGAWRFKILTTLCDTKFPNSQDKAQDIAQQ